MTMLRLLFDSFTFLNFQQCESNILQRTFRCCTAQLHCCSLAADVCSAPGFQEQTHFVGEVATVHGLHGATVQCNSLRPFLAGCFAYAKASPQHRRGKKANRDRALVTFHETIGLRKCCDELIWCADKLLGSTHFEVSIMFRQARLMFRQAPWKCTLLRVQ